MVVFLPGWREEQERRLAAMGWESWAECRDGAYVGGVRPVKKNKDQPAPASPAERGEEE